MPDDFINFLTASPSSYHAAHTGAHLLAQAGFTHHTETDPWDAQPGGHYLIRGGALIAWHIPTQLPTQPAFRIIGAHTDSPGFKLKHTPDHTTYGFNQAAVEIYGGPIISSWFDRDLKLAGIITHTDGTTHLYETPPLLRIPNLAIHLDRNPTVDRQHHTTPIYGTTTNPTSILPTNTCTHDLITVDTQPPGRLGTDHKLLAAGRLDNLSSVYPAITALIEAADAATDILILACFDHEEIGSATTTGAAGPILQDTLERTAYALGLNLDETKRAYQRSTCVSADAAHSIHPNYPTHHDPHNYPQLGHGPVLKINANHRYASTAETQAHWLKHCPESQHFVSNNNTPCGTTIGPITATRLGIPTVDVGIPLLSMHSARELCHLDDITALHKALTNYLVG